MRKSIRLIGVLFLLCTCAFAQKATHYWVSVDGDDHNSGSKDKPFATLEKARDEVRNLIESGRKGDKIINLQPGTYRLNKTFQLDLNDGGLGDDKVIYQGESAESVTITSCHPLSKWEKVTKLPQGFLPSVNGKIWVCTLPSKPGSSKALTFKTLYTSNKRLLRARSKGFSPARQTPTEMSNKENYQDLNTFEYSGDDLKNWTNLEDVELFLNPGHFWLVNYLPITSVDETGKIATTGIDATYGMSFLRKQGTHYASVSAWVENIPEVLDEPGEWYLNSKENKLYLWPESEEQLNDIFAPCLEQLVKVEGEIDYDGLTDTPIRNISFRNLTMSGCDRDTWTKDSKGLQHDWDMFDADNSLLRFRGAENCVVENCVFENTGATAVRFDLYAQNNTVRNCHIHNIGLTGILLSGYGPGLKDVNKGNFIIDNSIHDTGEIYYHGIPVFISQSGYNEVKNNYIYNTPYNALVVSGARGRFFETIEKANSTFNFTKDYHHPKNRREWMKIIRWDEIGMPKHYSDIVKFNHAKHNLIQDNEFHNTVLRLGDGNTAYFSSTGMRNVFKRNLMYNNAYAAGTLRCDDDQFGLIITENICYGTNGFRIKHANTCTNNILIPENGRAIQYGKTCAQDRKVIKEHHIDPLISNNIVIGQSKISPINPNEKGGLKLELKLSNNIVFGNDTASLNKHIEKLQKRDLDTGSVVADPLFVDIDNFNFTLEPESPALKSGFKQIDFSKIGRLNNPSFKRIKKEGWPQAQENYFKMKPKAWWLKVSKN